MVILLPMLLSALLSGSMVAKQIENGFRNRVVDNLQAVIYSYEDYKKKARDNASLLSSVTELRQYAMEGNNLKASQFLVPLATEVGLDFIMIADKDKKLLSRTDQPSRFGDDLSGDFMVKSGFAGYKAVSVTAYDHGLIIQSVSPMKSGVEATGTETIGAIVTQYNLDKRFIDNIKKANGVECTLYVNDSIISTLVDKDAEDLRIDKQLKTRLISNNKSQFEKKKIGNTYYSVAYTVLTDNKNKPVGIVSIAMNQGDITKAKNNIQLILFAICILGILFAVLIGSITSRSIVKPIKKLIKDTAIIAQGNLAYKSDIKGKGEIGRLSREFNTMADSLKILVTKISGTVNNTIDGTKQLNKHVRNVNNISLEVENASKDLQIGSEKQVLQLEETKVKLDNISKNAENIFIQTENIVICNNSTKKVVEQEEKSLKLLKEEMIKTKGRMSHMSDKINNFRNDLGQIGKMTEIITGIASQTKLLSFNASIEAARAGEVGKGFNVVAQEIRKLSEESDASVNNIKKVIKHLFDEMENTTVEVEKNVANVETVSGIVDNTEEAFEEIVKSITNMNNMLYEISLKSKNQAVNTSEIADLINEIIKVAQNVCKESIMFLDGSNQQVQSLEGVMSELKRLIRDMQNTKDLLNRFVLD